MSRTNNYISIRNILGGKRPHVVLFNDRDQRDRERALDRAQAIAGTRDFAKVSAIWKAAKAPLASIPVVGAPASASAICRPGRGGPGRASRLARWRRDR